MIFLLDTNAVSDLMREHPEVVRRLSNMTPGDQAITCTIVRGEVLFGVERLPSGARRREIEVKAARVLSALPCYAVPAEAADHYTRVKIARADKGLSLDENDLWIAATALSMQATLVTRDTDFGGIDGLSLEDWTR